MQPAHDGSDGDAEDVRRLRVREPIEIDEAHHLSVAFWKPVVGFGDDGVERLADDHSLGIAGTGRRDGREIRERDIGIP